MPSLSLPDRLIWFAHCPKAGGTSIEQFMVATWGDAVGHLHWGWDLWWRRGGWREANPPNSPQHLTWTDAAQCLPRSPDLVFAVVRDPVRRMLSEYRWQRHRRRGTRAGKILAYLPFPIWLRLMLAMAGRNPYAFDNHFRPQADFIPTGAHVFRLEDGLEGVTRWLTEAAGYPRSDGLAPHAIPSGPAPRISARDRGLIGQFFATDYARFGYPHPKGRNGRLGLARLAAPLLVHLDRHGRL